MNALSRLLSYAAALAASLLLAACERPPIDSVQTGYRGTGMVQVYNPRTVADQIPVNQPLAAQPAASPDGPRAKDVYKNLQVLGDLSVGELTRHMTAITAWVSPKEGCAYCHNLTNLADDSKYTKVVARRMVQMTQNLNSKWKTHVAETGVTCYTCHRGEPVPQQLWFGPVAQQDAPYFIGNRNGQNAPARTVGLASLPNDPFTPYLKKTSDIRIAGPTALPTGHEASIQQTEGTYGLMIHMSNSLGVNCTYCHNTRSFGNWDESSPQRTTAWHGLRMVGEINNTYLEPLTGTFPATRRGPTGDVAKANCATCHQGAYKPLYGAAMAKDHPELLAPTGGVAATPAAATATGTLPAPVAEELRSVLYFNVGSAALAETQSKGMSRVIASLAATPGAKATISGYHSAAGTLAQNEELAKQRAFSVRDALVAAGVAESRVVLSKPQQTEANVAGEDPAARRVEVTVK
jgi:photosynthetic reaction center cytochrome c subunit